MKTKGEMRQQMKRLRSELSKEQIRSYSESLMELIWQKFLVLNGEVLHTYLPLPQEIDTFPLVKKVLASGKKVVAPKTLPDRMLQHLILQDIQQLKKGRFNTLIPSNEIEYQGDYSIIVVPALAFDRNHYRLGYGGGYYDGFLKANPRAFKMGVAYPFQVVDEVPKEVHDAQVDEVLWLPNLT